MKANKQKKCSRCKKVSTNFRSGKRTNGKKYSIGRCRICENKLNNERHHKKMKNPEYRKIHNEKFREYRMKNLTKVRARAKIYKKSLADGYVIAKIRGKNAGLTKEKIPNKLIELKRLQLLAKRTLKNQTK